MAKDKKQLSALERAVMQCMGDGREVGRADDPARDRWPVLWEWLTSLYVGKDYLKSPAVISIRCGPEGVLASLVDRDLQLSTEVSVPTLEGVFEALNSELSKETPNLKFWGKGEPHLRKRRNGQ